MAPRQEERNKPEGLRYCVFCTRYFSEHDWATHEHNPAVSQRHRADERRRGKIGSNSVPDIKERIDWAAEAGRTYSERSIRRFLSVSKRRTKRKIRNLAALSIRLIIGAIAASYVAVAIVHVSNGFSWGDSLGMPFEDYRTMIECPAQPALVWDFIDRTDRYARPSC